MFIPGENLSPFVIRAASVWSAYFAVPYAFAGMKRKVPIDRLLIEQLCDLTVHIHARTFHL